MYRLKIWSPSTGRAPTESFTDKKQQDLGHLDLIFKIQPCGTSDTQWRVLGIGKERSILTKTEEKLYS